MSLFKFNNEFSANSCCEYCQLVDAYIGAILESDNIQELRKILHELVEDSFESGFNAAIQANMSFLESIRTDQGYNDEYDDY